MQRHDQDSDEQIEESLDFTGLDASTSLQASGQTWAARGVRRSHKPIYTIVPSADPQLTAGRPVRYATSSTAHFSPASRWTSFGRGRTTSLGAQHGQQYFRQASSSHTNNRPVHTIKGQPRSYGQVYNSSRMTINQSMHGFQAASQAQPRMEQPGSHRFQGTMPIPPQRMSFTGAAQPRPVRAQNFFRNPSIYNWATDQNYSHRFPGMGERQLPGQLLNNNVSRNYAHEQRAVSAAKNKPKRNLNSNLAAHWNPSAPFPQLSRTVKKITFADVTKEIRNFLRRFKTISEQELSNEMGIPQPILHELLLPTKTWEDVNQDNLPVFKIMKEWVWDEDRLPALLRRHVWDKCINYEHETPKKKRRAAHLPEESSSSSNHAGKDLQHSAKTVASHCVSVTQPFQSLDSNSTNRDICTETRQTYFGQAASPPVTRFSSQPRSSQYRSASQHSHWPAMPRYSELDDRNAGRPLLPPQQQNDAIVMRNMPAHSYTNFVQGGCSHQINAAAFRENVFQNMPTSSRLILRPANPNGKILPDRRQAGATVVGQDLLPNAPIQSRPSIADSNVSEPSEVSQEQSDVVVALQSVIKDGSPSSDVASVAPVKKQD